MRTTVTISANRVVNRTPNKTAFDISFVIDMDFEEFKKANKTRIASIKAMLKPVNMRVDYTPIYNEVKLLEKGLK